MYGAIIGDIAGSIYEYEETKKIKPIKINQIIEENSFYSDDTILTIAIADAILNDRDYEKYLRNYIKKYRDYKPNFSPYFRSSFSPGLIKWSLKKETGMSTGNGALMRISPVGYLFNSEEEVIKNARLATIPSHNSKEAIDNATKLALIIYYFRKGLTKDEVYTKLEIKLNFKPFEKFNCTCSETIDNCLYVLYYSNSFDDAIKKIISLGGDTDTNASIVGAMAEALYGVDKSLINAVDNKIPTEFVRVLKKEYQKNL
jgi:ADP-ribosylglycohydrolase